MSSKIKNIGMRIVMTLAIPVVVYIFLKIVCTLFGDPSFGVGSDLQTITYTAIYTTMIALAMSYNMFSGRFDFAVGATISLSAILGGNIAKDNGFGALGLLLITILIAMILGLISGLVYVTLSLPPMITSMGLAMIYEAVGLMYNKSKGIRMTGSSSLIFARQQWLWILLIAVVIISTFIFEYTRFGYNRSAIASGQKIAVDIGIREKRNAVGCWVAAGALLGVAAVIYLSKYGYISPEAGLSSSSYFMGAFLPLFIGGAIARYSNSTIGIVIGAFTSAMISSGFVKLGFNSSMQTVMNGACVMLLLVYTSNSYKLSLRKLYKAKLERAAAAKKM